MWVRFSRIPLSLAMTMLFVVAAVWAQAPVPMWKDRAEYDLVESIKRQTHNARKLELLNTWQTKYPDTDFKRVRLGLYLAAYQALKQVDKAAETEKEILAEDQKLQALSRPVIYDPRPLEQVADCLEAKYGWRITYEDPLVLYQGDLRDESAQYRRSGSGPLCGRTCGRIDMRDVLPPVLTAQDDAAVLLQRAIDLHDMDGGVGVFRLLRTGDVFHVIPVKTKDENGRVVEAGSLLDTPITIPEQERTVGQTVGAITDAVSLGTSVTVEGNCMYMRHDREKVVFGAWNEPARSALLRLFDKTGNETTTWWLLCGAGVRHCTLNVRYIQVEVEAPDLSRKRVPLF